MSKTLEVSVEETDFVVDDTPEERGYRGRGKWTSQFMGLIEILLTVPEGKSVKKGFPTATGAKSFYQSLYTFIKKRGLKGSYFIRCERLASADSRFYVWIGKKKEN